MQRSWRKPLGRWLSGAALLLASGAAMALGLGDIQVKSLPGQPLVAEIPIISSDPAEMEQLQARLASPATFERVGLQRPTGLIGELNFMVGVSDEGQPIIRVTSARPVTQDVVSFLIEVDWGQGRLVREYAAMVNAPGTVAAVNEPVIDTPAAAPSDTIVREPEAPAEPLPPPAEVAQAEPEQKPEQAPAPEAVPLPPPAPRPSAPAIAAAPPVQPGDALGQVRRGQTLSEIAAGLRTGQSLNQTMLALLRANPDAFINGNINLLKQGAVLRMPPSAELARLSRAEANALVSQQVAEWRQARRPVPQPVAAAPAAVDAAPASPGAASQADAARLEIAPAAADATKRTGTTSGLQAGGEGDMLTNQQVQQAKEDLAARESEVQELRAQVAELEKIKQQQQKLLALKDTDLAAAQQRLGQAQPGAEVQPQWLWAGLALLVAGLVAGWLLPRRRKEKPASPSRFDAATLEAALPPAFAADARNPETAEAPRAEPEAPSTWGLPAAGKPTWHTGPGVDVAPLNAAPAGRERLELAIAYLDLGDKTTARSLLNEVVAGSDAEARAQATQLLREIG